MRQRIIVSGLGGQGVLTVAWILAETAAAAGLEVLTSETHGMAQRGGTVISMISAGPYRGPLIPAGRADTGLFLYRPNLDVHRYLMKPGGNVFVNTASPGDYSHMDAGSMASEMGNPIIANLIMLGFAAGSGALFCSAGAVLETISRKTPPRFLDLNLAGFRAGVDEAGGGS